MRRAELPPGTDAAEVIRAVSAPLYYRLLVSGDPIDEATADRAAEAAAARAGAYTPASSHLTTQRIRFCRAGPLGRHTVLPQRGVDLVPDRNRRRVLIGVVAKPAEDGCRPSPARAPSRSWLW